MSAYAELIGTLTGTDQETALKFIRAMELVMLHELYEKGWDNEENGTIKTERVDLYAPLIGRLGLYPVNRNNKDETTNDGYTFKSVINLDKRMLQKIKTTYYDHYDYLKDVISDNFLVQFPEDFKSMI